MRLFVALEVPARVREAVHTLVAAARDELPPARWMRDEAIHLTLVFLGERDPRRVAEIVEALRPVFAGSRPLFLRPAASGRFPVSGSPRVLWVGFEPDEELSALQRGVAETLAALLDEPAERRRFHPHLTLARCRRRWPRRAVERWLQTVEAGSVAGFEVDHGTLFESRLSPRGARYEAVERFPLGVAA